MRFVLVAPHLFQPRSFRNFRNFLAISAGLECAGSLTVSVVAVHSAILEAATKEGFAAQNIGTVCFFVIRCVAPACVSHVPSVLATAVSGYLQWVCVRVNRCERLHSFGLLALVSVVPLFGPLTC